MGWQIRFSVEYCFYERKWNIKPKHRYSFLGFEDGTLGWADLTMTPSPYWLLINPSSMRFVIAICNRLFYCFHHTLPTYSNADEPNKTRLHFFGSAGQKCFDCFATDWSNLLCSGNLFKNFGTRINSPLWIACDKYHCPNQHIWYSEWVCVNFPKTLTEKS